MWGSLCFHLLKGQEVNNKKIVILFMGFCFLSILFFQSCSGFMGIPAGEGINKGTSTGNPSLHLSFGPFLQAPIMMQKINAVGSSENLDNVSVIFCMANLTFKTIQDYVETGDVDVDGNIVKHIAFKAQEYSISPLGTDLGFVSVPTDSYRQIEFLLSGNSCESQKSVQVVNSYGTFATGSEIKLKFNGNKPIYFSTDELQMLIVPIIEALATVTSNEEIKGKIESVNGLIRD